MRIVCISDTHERHNQLAIPEGDVLIHAGDATFQGKVETISAFNEWLGTLPHKHKLVIAGNHDWLFQREPTLALSIMSNATYLEDGWIVLDGVKFYGSPWQPTFCNWAFNLPRGESLRAKWERIPRDTNILITHGPPHGIGDDVVRFNNRTGEYIIERVGCEELRKTVDELPDLKLHVFGHIHKGYGQYGLSGKMFVNASLLDDDYRVAHKPIVIDL